jgi:hypothetical protein
VRSILGLLWALGGAVAGFVVGAVVAIAIAKLTNAPNREGAHGYFMMALGIIGAVVGIVAGIALYGRSAPAGQGAAYTGSGALGVVGLVAAIAISIWAFLNLREAPLEYDGTLANLEMVAVCRSADFENAPRRHGDWVQQT